MVAISRMPPPSWVGMVMRPDDRLDGAAVFRLAGKGAVKVDNMQQFRPLVLPDLCLGAGVVVEDRVPLHQPLLQADTFPFFQINRRYDNH